MGLLGCGWFSRGFTSVVLCVVLVCWGGVCAVLSFVVIVGGCDYLISWKGVCVGGIICNFCLRGNGVSWGSCDLFFNAWEEWRSVLTGRSGICFVMG